MMACQWSGVAMQTASMSGSVDDLQEVRGGHAVHRPGLRLLGVELTYRGQRVLAPRGVHVAHRAHLDRAPEEGLEQALVLLAHADEAHVEQVAGGGLGRAQAAGQDERGGQGGDGGGLDERAAGMQHG
jgi:hypothetical protein